MTRLTDLVLIASKWPPEYGGPGIYYNRNVARVAALADRLHVIALNTVAPPEVDRAVSHVAAIGMPVSSSWLGRRSRGIRLAVLLYRLLRTKRHSSGIVFAGGEISNGWRPVAIAMWILGVPVIVENVLQGADDGASLLRARGRWLTHAAARRLRCFCPVSSGLASAVRASFPDARAVQLPYGVDLEYHAVPSAEQRATARAAISGCADGFVAVSFGAIHERKGQLPLVDAWLQWVERGRRHDSRLFLVGPPSDAAYVAAIQQRLAAATAEAAGTVTLAGFREDTATYLRAADVYLSAARAEGLPISVVEALASGVPVVCRALEGVTDDFLYGQAVSAIAGWNALQVGHALDTLLDSQIRSQASRDARVVAENRFDITKRLALISNLLAGSPPIHGSAVS
jgi:glycosyltransferase involved in cell wall biosynthesis